MNKKVIIISAFALLLLAGAMVLPIGGTVHSAAQPQQKVQGMDLSSFSSARPNRPLRLLFIHHSVGGQLLADPGPEQNLADSIHATHPNGGGLRKVLEQQGYQVHEASYGSVVGEDTDLFDWLPKFQTKMDRILKVSFNDRLLSGDERNDIVVFKSCYPNNRFASEGQAPGNPAGPELTVWNAKATLTALLAEFQKHPNTLFMYVTAPPTAS
ncbi:MAG: hypothetical protein MUF54_08785, partial [Polyangiaceae bacterium]|nr:hypothetical protein [Polyangiaceae bacterium]